MTAVSDGSLAIRALRWDLRRSVPPFAWSRHCCLRLEAAARPRVVRFPGALPLIAQRGVTGVIARLPLVLG